MLVSLTFGPVKQADIYGGSCLLENLTDIQTI